MGDSHCMPSPREHEHARLRAEIESLRTQLDESQETLRAIREGEVDALVVSTPDGERVFTLQGGDHPYRALIEQMREGAVTITPEGVVHYCNSRFAEMLDLPLERVIGRRVEDFVAPAAARRSPPCSRRAGDGRSWASWPPRTEVPVLMSATALRADGPAALCLVVADLTESKRQAAEKDSAEQAKAVAEQANRTKNHFLAVLSHELRTPLTPVVMGLSMLQDRSDLDPAVRETLDMVRRNVEVEARLIDDFLDVSRIARGKIEFKRSTVELSAVIQGAVEVCQSEIETRKLHFGVDLGPAAAYWVDADAARLQQVFWNLLKNAIKFTPHGGCVGLRCRPDGAHVVIEVNDSGMGIEPAALAGFLTPSNRWIARSRSSSADWAWGWPSARRWWRCTAAGSRHKRGPGPRATFRIRLPLSAAAAARSARALRGPAVRPPPLADPAGRRPRCDREVDADGVDLGGAHGGNGRRRGHGPGTGRRPAFRPVGQRSGAAGRQRARPAAASASAAISSRASR